MKIDTHNYEVYILDYLEGQLSPQAEEAMRRFLEQQPEIADQLEGLEEMVLQPDRELKFEKKELLMKKTKTSTLIYWPWALLLLLFLSLPLIYHGIVSPEPKASENKSTFPPPVLSEENNKERADKIVPTTQKQEAKTTEKEENTVAPSPKQFGVKPEENRKPIATNPINKDSTNNTISPKEIAPTEQKEEIKEAIPTIIPIALKTTKEINQDIKPNEIPEHWAAMTQIDIPQPNKTTRSKKSREINTPFGKLRWSDIADALLPETFASIK